MITLLSKIFIRDRDNVASPAVRRAYGALCSIVGISLNVLLFGLKYLAGTLAGSIAVTADAFNNLSDAGSSIITLLGFRLAAKKPDPGHPFGHGRIEYVTGLIVSILIIFMALELGRSSAEKIIAHCYSKESLEYATLLHNKGHLAQLEGMYDEAKELLSQAKGLQIKFSGKPLERTEKYLEKVEHAIKVRL